MQPAPSRPPVHDLDLAPPHAVRENLAGGGFLLRSPVPLAPSAPSIAHLLRHWASIAGERVFLAERDSSGSWRRVTYADASRAADSVAQALIERGASAERPILILSGNSIDHALLMLGAFVAGIPVVPVSVAYSLMSQDHAKLKHIFDEIRPTLVFAAHGKTFEKALASLDLSGVEVVVSTEPPAGVKTTPFSALLSTAPTADVARAFATIGPNTVAKILYTSGSTGLPKGVINTHRMMTANQTMMEQVWPFLKKQPFVLLDWLPWNHTFGANHNFNMVVAQGGTLYIDGGKPAPNLIEESIRNLREISPTIYFNVPVGFGMLLPYLEKDETLARKFFSELKLIFYAGAALSQDLWERLENISVRTTGKRVPMVSSWGATETAPAATAGHLFIDRAGVIGLPPPGVDLKFVPAGSKLEIRVKGPNVFPGYWKRPDLTRDAFDEEGFYRIGDAGKLADENDPGKGVVFDGRVAEDFKLSTGTWVHAGGLRVAAIAAAAPALQDAVVTGHDRDYPGLLAWPNLNGLKDICRDTAKHGDPASLVASADVREHVRKGIAAHNARQTGSSTQVRRVLLLLEPPSIDANEITDKGYINQRAVLERRRAFVERLHAAEPDAAVIRVD
jgi:feruloyl-CoA synthase